MMSGWVYFTGAALPSSIVSSFLPFLPLLDNYLARDGEKRLLSNSGGQ